MSFRTAAAVAALAFATVLPTHAEEATLSTDDLMQAIDQALGAFQTTRGDVLAEAIESYEGSKQGNSAEVRIQFKESGLKKTDSYRCAADGAGKMNCAFAAETSATGAARGIISDDEAPVTFREVRATSGMALDLFWHRWGHFMKEKVVAIEVKRLPDGTQGNVFYQWGARNRARYLCHFHVPGMYDCHAASPNA